MGVSMANKTASDAEQKLAALEFMGPIIQAQVAFDQAMSNQLQERAWEDARKWAQAYADLVARIEAVNDSLKVDRALWQGPDWGEAERAIEHYNRMLGEPTEIY